jgi:GNAT superfamily N-acetyltransferase
MEVIIRNAEEQNVEPIALLLTELGYPADASFVRAKLEELKAYPTVTMLIAEWEGTVAGVICFDSQPLFHQAGKIGTIMALAVSHAHRGLGIGRRLVEYIETLALEMGCIKIAVASGVHREDAHSFYRRLGYEEITKRFVKQLSELATASLRP